MTMINAGIFAFEGITFIRPNERESSGKIIPNRMKEILAIFEIVSLQLFIQVSFLVNLGRKTENKF